jgi:hypothetical protein
MCDRPPSESPDITMYMNLVREHAARASRRLDDNMAVCLAVRLTMRSILPTLTRDPRRLGLAVLDRTAHILSAPPENRVPLLFHLWRTLYGCAEAGVLRLLRVTSVPGTMPLSVPGSSAPPPPCRSGANQLVPEVAVAPAGARPPPVSAELLRRAAADVEGRWMDHALLEMERMTSVRDRVVDKCTRHLKFVYSSYPVACDFETGRRVFGTATPNHYIEGILLAAACGAGVAPRSTVVVSDHTCVMMMERMPTLSRFL